MNDETRPADREQFKVVSLAALARQLDDLDEMMKDDHVQDLAKSIRENGTIEPPVVSAKGRKIICGRRRIAAHHLLGTEAITVKLIRCTAAEAERITLEENLRRAPPRARSALSLQAIEERVDGGMTESEAIQDVAVAAGIKPSSLRRQRDRRRKSKPKPTSPGGKPVPPSIETFTLGPYLKPEFVRGVKMVQYRIDESVKGINACLGQVRALLKSHTDLIHRGTIERLEKEIESLKGTIQAHKPIALCPYCKGVTEVQAECVVCMGTGYVGRDVIPKAPKELLRTDEKMVSFRGEIIPMAQVDPDEEPL